jgi:hypothetical protein
MEFNQEIIQLFIQIFTKHETEWKIFLMNN